MFAGWTPNASGAATRRSRRFRLRRPPVLTLLAARSRARQWRQRVRHARRPAPPVHGSASAQSPRRRRAHSRAARPCGLTLPGQRAARGARCAKSHIDVVGRAPSKSAWPVRGVGSDVPAGSTIERRHSGRPPVDGARRRLGLEPDALRPRCPRRLFIRGPRLPIRPSETRRRFGGRPRQAGGLVLPVRQHRCPGTALRPVKGRGKR